MNPIRAGRKLSEVQAGAYEKPEEFYEQDYP